MCNNMQDVQSLNIKSVGYDEDTNILYVMFLNENLYTYSNVPATAYSKLMTANSIGIYLNIYIKPFYYYNKIS